MKGFGEAEFPSFTFEMEYKVRDYVDMSYYVIHEIQ